MLYDLFVLPEAGQLARVTVQIVVSIVLGGLLGVEREATGQAAGLRTHMLVSLGCTLFVLVPAELGLTESDLGRVIQGIAAGIGFLGAGTILKRADQNEITGLTTAATIWVTAAVGVAVGIGHLWVPALATACALFILHVLPKFERLIPGSGKR
jgi:putative Mg2+ transporter-C (MgtC) family protein